MNMVYGIAAVVVVVIVINVAVCFFMVSRVRSMTERAPKRAIKECSMMLIDSEMIAAP